MPYSSQQLTDSFAIGHAYARPFGGLLPANPTPFEFETITEITLDWKGKIVELRGQYLVPVDARMADVTITGKATIGTYNLNQVNNLLFAGQLNLSNIDRVNADETHTIPSSPPYSITVTNSASFTEDLGVSYAIGAPQAGAQFEEVTSLTLAGQYVQPFGSPLTPGEYGFDVADAGLPVNISYIDNNGVGATLTLPNNLQGQSPIFEFVVLNSGNNSSSFVGYRLFNCRASGIKILTGKNNAFNMVEVDFSAFCPVGQNVGELIQTAV